MKRVIQLIPKIAFLNATILFSLLAKADIATGVYKLSSDSRIEFEAVNFWITSVNGRFTKIDGSVDWKGSPEVSSLKVIIQTKSIDTENEERDHHLRSSDFFDIEKFPEAQFVSSKIELKSEALKVIGTLTLHGVSKEIELNGIFNEKDKIFSGETTIDRTQFDIKSGPSIKNRVRLKLFAKLAI